MSIEEKKDNENENYINVLKEYINNCQDDIIKKVDINNNLKETIPEDKLNELLNNIFKDSNEELEKIKILEILNNLQTNNINENEKEDFKVENNNDNNILGDLNLNNNLDLVLPSNKIKLPVLEFKPNPHKNKIYSEDIKNQQKKKYDINNILNNNNNISNKNDDKQNRIFEKINSFKNEFFYPKNSMTEEKKINKKSYYNITNKYPSNNNNNIKNNDFKKRAEKLQYLDHNKKVDLRDSNQRNEYVNDIKGKIQNFSNTKKEKENNYKNIKSPFDDINDMLESFKNKRNKENKNEENKQE